MSRPPIDQQKGRPIASGAEPRGARTLPKGAGSRRALASLKRLRLPILVATALLLAPMVLYVLPQLAGADKAYVVLSGSMSPTFNAGDFIVDDAFKPGDPLAPGDILTYKNSAGTLVTHRALGITGEPGSRLITTQGDANNAPDSDRLSESRVVGVYQFHVPYYGYVVGLALQPIGKVLFIILPSAVVFVLELTKLVRRVVAAERKMAALGSADPVPAPSAAPVQTAKLVPRGPPRMPSPAPSARVAPSQSQRVGVRR